MATIGTGSQLQFHLLGSFAQVMVRPRSKTGRDGVWAGPCENMHLDGGGNYRIDVRPDPERTPCSRLRFTPATRPTIRAWLRSRASSASVASMRAGSVGRSSIPI